MERSLHINVTPIRLTLNIISPVATINLTGVDCSKMLLLETQSEKRVSVLGYLCICCKMILTLTQSKRTSRIIDWCESCFMTFSLYLFDIFWETINFLQSFQLWQWLFCHTQPDREIFLKEILIISQFVCLTALYYLDENILLYDQIAWTRRKTDDLCMPLYVITVTIMPVKTLYLLLWH